MKAIANGILLSLALQPALAAPALAVVPSEVQKIIRSPNRLGYAYPYKNCFEKTARDTRLPTSLLVAVAKGESNFNPRAVSKKNAIGLMQIRWPITARDLGIHSREKLYEPCLNIQAGGTYLARLLKRYDGNLYRALAAYNYGPGRITKNGSLPFGARDYVDYIYRKYRRLSTVPIRGAPPVSLTFTYKGGKAKIRRLVLYPFNFRFSSYARPHFRDLTNRVRLKNVSYEIEKDEKGYYQIVAYYKGAARLRQAIVDKIRSVTGWEVDPPKPR